jgi:hypothetical protein
MFNEFPYLKITEDLQFTVGKAEEDTRIFRKNGRDSYFREWIIELNKMLKGNLIPSTWVPAYVGVSRAAVHKRIKSGRLTMFVFQYEESYISLTMKWKSRKTAEFSYCVRSECQAWKDEIEHREAMRRPPELRNCGTS